MRLKLLNWTSSSAAVTEREDNEGRFCGNKGAKKGAEGDRRPIELRWTVECYEVEVTPPPTPRCPLKSSLLLLCCLSSHLSLREGGEVRGLVHKAANTVINPRDQQRSVLPIVQLLYFGKKGKKKKGSKVNPRGDGWSRAAGRTLGRSLKSLSISGIGL